MSHGQDTGETIDRGASYWIPAEPSTEEPPTPKEEDPKKVGLLNHS